MRNSEQIEAQTEETGKLIVISDNSACEQASSKPSPADRIRPWMWKPGQSGNPAGRPKDMARVIAQAAFENNPEMLYEAYVKALSKGSGFVFQVLSDRAYGKLKERIELEGNLTVGARLEKARKRKLKK